MPCNSNLYIIIEKIMENKAQDAIIDAILDAMQSPDKWKKTWRWVGGQCNHVSKKQYTGGNAFLLAYLQIQNNYRTGQRLTFKQAKWLGWQVKKWEKATQIVFWKFLKTQDKDGEEKQVPLLRYYSVFNIDQTTLEPLAFEPNDNDTLPQAESIANKYLQAQKIELLQDWYACYIPALDKIKMPDLKLFDTSAHYYQTLYHEMIHSTGHKARLNRAEVVGTNGFGKADKAYAIEELVAEFWACLLAVNTVDVDIPNAWAYLASRANHIKANDRKKEVMQAIQRAKKASEYVLSIDTI